MDKEYVLWSLEQRIAELKIQYQMSCHSKDEKGAELTYGAAAKRRYFSKRDLNICYLVQDLLRTCKCNLTVLSDEAIEALNAVLEPCERHRRLAK